MAQAMTKERLTRLINLAVQRERENGLRETADAVAYNDLLMEFQAWEPAAGGHRRSRTEETLPNGENDGE